jgi:RNase P/RNase MRP subunit POP5
MKKLNLKSSSRDNRRYILLEEKDKQKIERAILDYIGILGFAKSAPMIIENEGRIILSCLREKIIDVRASLDFAKIKISKVSGTIEGLSR